MLTYFAELTLTICFNSAVHPNEVNTFLIYVKEDIFVRRQFHKFLEFFAKVYLSR